MFKIIAILVIGLTTELGTGYKRLLSRYSAAQEGEEIWERR